MHSSPLPPPCCTIYQHIYVPSGSHRRRDQFGDASSILNFPDKAIATHLPSVSTGR
jgi:hypothetical protein